MISTIISTNLKISGGFGDYFCYCENIVIVFLLKILVKAQIFLGKAQSVTFIIIFEKNFYTEQHKKFMKAYGSKMD